MKFADEIVLGWVFIGTLIGAGFASGQEIIRFFTIHGKWGLAGLGLSCLLFFLAGYLILTLAIRRQSSSIRDILLPYAGKRLMGFFEILVYFFLMAGFFIMISGCSALLEQSLKLSYTPWSLVLSVLCLLGLSRGLKGLAALNNVLVPVMMILMIIISYTSLRDVGGIFKIIKSAPPGESGWWISSLLYFSYNMTSISVVLASWGKYTRRQEAALGAGIISGLGVFVMALGIYFITVMHFEKLVGVQIPLLEVAKSSSQIYWAAAMILLLAMITTALSYGYALITTLSERLGWNYKRTLVFLMIGWPFTLAGFSKLVYTIYPLFGIIGIFLMVILLLRRFF